MADEGNFLLMDMQAFKTPGGLRRLLIVEDDRSVRRLVRRIFEDNYEVFEAGDGEEGLRLALELEPAVVIADQRMPKILGVEMLSRVREALPQTVRVLISGYNDYGPVVDAVNAAHVHTYIEKPFHRDDLKTAVNALVSNAELTTQRDVLLKKLQEAVQNLQETNRALREKEVHLSRTVDDRTLALRESVEQLRESNRRLQHLAVRDSLTGLFNHRSLMEHLELEVARSARYERFFSLLFLDLDDFKQVNDTYGHRVGDDVLRNIAELLRDGPEGLRRSDYPARYGGEEFCVILPETAAEGALIKAERLRSAVEEFDWKAARLEMDRVVTVSIGVASYPEHGRTSEQLLQVADAALYEAKRKGKNCVVMGARVES